MGTVVRIIASRDWLASGNGRKLLLVSGSSWPILLKKVGIRIQFFQRIDPLRRAVRVWDIITTLESGASKMNHELWLGPDGCQTFCLAGAHGDSARALMHSEATLVWEVEAENHFEAMTKYYAHMQWGEYRTDFPEQDRTPYRKLGRE